MAEPSIGRGVLEVGFDSKQIEQAGKEQLLPSAQRVIGDVARVAGAVKLFQVGKEGLDELKQAEAANAQLASVIQSTGNAAGISADHIDDLSQAALKNAGVDDEAAKKADTLLLQLGKFANTDLGHKNFDRAAEAAVNLSVRMGTDVPAAAQQLAVVLQKPEAGLGRLRRSVGDLSAEQQASLNHFIAVGDVAGAQSVILDKLDEAVGGAGAAFGDSLPGKLAIAQESLKNMKAELVAGAAPALKIGADAVTFLTDKFAELPAGAQTAVGGIVLIGGAATAIARPLGDVLRLVDRFRDSGEAIATAGAGAGTTLNTVAVGADSVAGAASAAASGTAELSTNLNTVATGASAAATKAAALTAAQGEQILAMRGLDTATVEQIASNEALTFSDEEVAFAQTQRLATNAPLIAAEDALIAQNAALAASNESVAFSFAGLAAAALPLAIGAGIGAGILAIGEGIGLGTKELPNFDKAMQDANATIGAFEDKAAEFTTEGLVSALSKTVTADQEFSTALNHAGVTTADLGRALVEGGDSFQSFIDKAAHAKGVTEADRIALGVLVNTTNDHAKASLDAAVATGQLDQKTVDAEAGLHKFNDGTTDSVGLLQALADKGLISKDAVDALNPSLAETSTQAGNAADSIIRVGTSAEGIKAAQETVANLASSFHDAAQRADEAFQAALQFAPADIRVQRGQIAIEADTEKVAEAEKKLADARKFGTPESVAAAERDLRTARLDLTDAILNEAQAQTELTKQQVEANNKTFDGSQFTQTYLGDLQALADKYGGPVRDSLAQYIFQTVSATNATIALRNAQQGTPNLTPEQSALAKEFAPGAFGGPGPHLASGGPVGPGPFVGAEEGFEVLLNEGTFQAPPGGGFVLNHRQSVDFLGMTAARGKSGLVIEGDVNLIGRDLPSAFRKLPDELRAAAYLAA